MIRNLTKETLKKLIINRVQVIILALIIIMRIDMDSFIIFSKNRRNTNQNKRLRGKEGSFKNKHKKCKSNLRSFFPDIFKTLTEINLKWINKDKHRKIGRNKTQKERKNNTSNRKENNKEGKEFKNKNRKKEILF